jgi:hypothetical protein
MSSEHTRIKYKIRYTHKVCGINAPSTIESCGRSPS